MPPPTAYVSWSSGKDSAFALYEAGRSGLARIAGVLTTINEAYDRVAMHGVRSALLDRQIVALGLPCIRVPLPSPCPNDVYETRMAHACAQIKSQGIAQIVFGDLFSRTFAPIASNSSRRPACTACFRCGSGTPRPWHGR